MTDVVVVGAGPAGRAIAARLVNHGASVTIVDPAPHRPWCSTYACWSDELPGWVPAQAVAVEVDQVRVRGHLTTDVPRRYSVLDTSALQRHLSDVDVQLRVARAESLSKHCVVLADRTRLSSDLIIDARGTDARGPRQTAWGVVMPTADAAPALDGAAAVLMDWRAPTPSSDPRPSFLYVVPLDRERVLIEETCLVGDPPIPLSELRARLDGRLKSMSIDPDVATDVEKVSFGMTGVSRRPWDHRPLLFGARAGLMHPATGYSVAAALGSADPLAIAVTNGRDPVRALWPRSSRIVHGLRARGLNVLLGLDAEQTRQFFDAFFAMPVASQRCYLSRPDDAGGVLAAMARVFGNIDGPMRRVIAGSALKSDRP